jgi:hypothetical protein
MRLKIWLAGMAGAATLGFLALPAEAAPAGAPAALKGALAQTADVQQAHWYGRRHRYRYRYHYGPRYGYRGHYYRPGFRFYYGPRYHHRRHWRRW